MTQPVKTISRRKHGELRSRELWPAVIVLGDAGLRREFTDNSEIVFMHRLLCVCNCVIGGLAQRKCHV